MRLSTCGRVMGPVLRFLEIQDLLGGWDSALISCILDEGPTDIFDLHQHLIAGWEMPRAGTDLRPC